MAGWQAVRGLRWALRGVLVTGLVTVVALGGWLARLKAEAADAADGARPFWRRPASGVLVIGGGGTPGETYAEFVALAGGPKARIVVIPTASGPGSEHTLDPWRPYRVASLAVYHATTRAEADDPAFAAALAGATGVWLNGGWQRRLGGTYAGTETERQLREVLRRGGVVGGTSAGAAVMTRVMIVAGRDTPELARGFDLLPGAVIDQHFLRRNRFGRLYGALREHPGLLGLGVDEQTALVVDVATRRGRVVGRSYVVACAPAPTAGAAPARLVTLKSGDEIDLDAFAAGAEHAVNARVEFDGL